MLLVVFVFNAIVQIPLPRSGQGSWDAWPQSILRLIYGSKGDRVAWFLTYPGREGSSRVLGILQRQRVGREETQSRFNSLVNYNLPRGALSTPLSSSISQKRGAWNTRRPQAARLFLSRRASGCTFGGKCELRGGTCSLGILPASQHPLLIHANTHPHLPSSAVSWAPRAGLMQESKMRNWPGLPCPWDTQAVNTPPVCS